MLARAKNGRARRFRSNFETGILFRLAKSSLPGRFNARFAYRSRSSNEVYSRSYAATVSSIRKQPAVRW